MGRSVNRVTLIGNAGGDPRITETEKGTRVAHLSLATDRRFVVDDEERQRTEWHRLTFWGKNADTAELLLRKGSRIYVEGRIEYGAYERDGVEVPTTDIVVRHFVLLDGRRDDDGLASFEGEVGAGEALEPA